MTATAFDAHAAPERHGWLAFSWILPLTAVWFAVNYWYPGLQASGVPNAFSRIFVLVMIALGLWLGVERAELTQTQRRNLWLAVMVPLTLWLSIVWCAAVNGLFAQGAVHFPLTPVAALGPVIVGAPILLRSKKIGQVLDAMPAAWLVALQLYRIMGMTFLIGWLYNRVPGVFALPAGTGDLLTGLMAVPTAVWLASGSTESKRGAIAWNIFGLLDFAIALSLGIMTAPGPLQLIVPSIPNTVGSVYPNVLIPTLAVPSSILLHLLSLRQLRRRAMR